MDTFSSDVLLKKVGSLQGQNDALAEEHARLKDSVQHSKTSNKRLMFLIDRTHNVNRNLRLAAYISGALAAVLVVACITLAQHSTAVSAKNKTLSAKNVLLRKEQRVVAEKMGKERQELRNAMAAAKTDNDNLRYELQKAQLGSDSVREEKTYLEDILIHKTKEIEKMKAAGSADTLKGRDEEIARLQDQNKLLSTKLDRLYKMTMDRLSAIGLAKSTLEETVADAKKRIDDEWNAVDLGSISVDRSAPARSAAAAGSVSAAAAPNTPKRVARTEGRVKAVNEAHGFVVVDLGKVDNLNEDSVLQIKKGGEWLATLTVLEVRDVMAACNIKNAVPGYNIRIDDPVFIQSQR